MITADGRVLAASANILGRPAVAPIDAAQTRPTARTMRGLPDDFETEDYRIWSARAETRDGTVAVFVGPSLETSQEAIHQLVTGLATGLPPLVLVLALAIWVAVGRALRPVENVRREVARLGVRSLDGRVPIPRTNDEVARLASTMNDLLERLETADRRQRDFVANASHDLQSPLTVFRTEIEVALTRADLEEWRSTGRHLLEESDRMEALVSDLLFLAQSEHLHSPDQSPLDLEDLVAEEVSRLDRGGPVRLVLRADATPVRGSRHQLSRMVRNLLLNATEFAHTQVTVTVSEVNGSAVLAVEDDGPGVPEDRREAVFDRFVTLDRARDRRTGGTGLGLAIARSVAESHGGTITVEGTAPSSRFVVRLPGL